VLFWDWALVGQGRLPLKVGGKEASHVFLIPAFIPVVMLGQDGLCILIYVCIFNSGTGGQMLARTIYT